MLKKLITIGILLSSCDLRVIKEEKSCFIESYEIISLDSRLQEPLYEYKTNCGFKFISTRLHNIKDSVKVIVY